MASDRRAPPSRPAGVVALGLKPRCLGQHALRIGRFRAHNALCKSQASRQTAPAHPHPAEHRDVILARDEFVLDEDLAATPAPKGANGRAVKGRRVTKEKMR
jgi:hypothetical protein